MGLVVTLREMSPGRTGLSRDPETSKRLKKGTGPASGGISQLCALGWNHRHHLDLDHEIGVGKPLDTGKKTNLCLPESNVRYRSVAHTRHPGKTLRNEWLPHRTCP